MYGGCEGNFAISNSVLKRSLPIRSLDVEAGLADAGEPVVFSFMIN